MIKRAKWRLKRETKRPAGAARSKGTMIPVVVIALLLITIGATKTDVVFDQWTRWTGTSHATLTTGSADVIITVRWDALTRADSVNTIARRMTETNAATRRRKDIEDCLIISSDEVTPWIGKRMAVFNKTSGRRSLKRTTSMPRTGG